MCAPALADEIIHALKFPEWPLYLGESDDSVDVELLGVETPQPTTQSATGAIGGVHEGGTLASLPARFGLRMQGKQENGNCRVGW